MIALGQKHLGQLKKIVRLSDTLTLMMFCVRESRDFIVNDHISQLFFVVNRNGCCCVGQRKVSNSFDQDRARCFSGVIMEL